MTCPHCKSANIIRYENCEECNACGATFNTKDWVTAELNHHTTPPPSSLVEGGEKPTCEKCGGEGALYTSKYGGNDPDVWPIGTFEECEGTGQCQYAEAVGMPEYRCVGECQYAAPPSRTSEALVDGGEADDPDRGLWRFWNAKSRELAAKLQDAQKEIETASRQYAALHKDCNHHYERAEAAEARAKELQWQVEQSAKEIKELDRELDELRRSLRDKFCPRPCNGRPYYFDVDDCVDAGECGCSARAALNQEAA